MAFWLFNSRSAGTRSFRVDCYAMVTCGCSVFDRILTHKLIFPLDGVNIYQCRPVAIAENETVIKKYHSLVAYSVIVVIT